jgi:hypothetical protein
MSIYRSLLFVVACATQKELARQVRYLKIENEVLRAKLPERIPTLIDRAALRVRAERLDRVTPKSNNASPMAHALH